MRISFANTTGLQLPTSNITHKKSAPTLPMGIPQKEELINQAKPESKLVSHKWLDYPISLLPFLVHQLEKKIKKHMDYLSSKNRLAKKFYIHLHCEYENFYHLLELDVSSPLNNVDNLMDIVERKLLEIDLSNPIREIEVETIPSSFKQNQVQKTRSRLTSGYYDKENYELDDYSLISHEDEDLIAI